MFSIRRASFHLSPVKATRICIPYIVVVCLLLSLPTKRTIAQSADTSDKVRITINNSGELIHTQTDSGEYIRFVKDVVLFQGTDTLYCDSLYENVTTKNLEAFNDVRIAQQGGTQGTCDYLRYTTQKKLAYMRGNVNLTDGKNNLKCEELTYNLGTKIAVYDQWGTLHNDSTTVTSKSGTYNSNTKDARFTGSANISDPQYKVKSEDMLYNTETKVTRFYAKSTVTRDNGKSLLQTSSGTYDGKNGVAHFTGHSSAWYSGQYIEGDTLNYSKITAYGVANGHVISIDTEHHSTLYCGHAEYFTNKKILWATIKPVLKQVNKTDTLYMRADTFYSAPMTKIKNTMLSTAGIGQNIERPTTLNSIAPPDSMYLNGSSYFNVNTAATDSIKSIKKTYPKLPDSLSDGNNRASFSTKDTLSGGKANLLQVASPIVDTAMKVKRGMPATKPGAKSAIKTAPIAKHTLLRIPRSQIKSNFEIPSAKPKFARPNENVTDTSYADTSAPIYFIGYHHVLILSDSLQGKCDSVCYTRSDSTIRMMYAPIAWAHNSQITGDTIIMHLDSSSMRNLYVPNNAFLVSQSGPTKAHLFDQVQGRTLNAYFTKSAIDSMRVQPDAESIYYTKDDKGAYLGVDQSKSVIIRVFFDDQKIMRIKLEKDAHITMTPLEKADLPNMKLSRYKWLIDQRPKNKEALFK